MSPSGRARSVAPDLIGFGDSEKVSGVYYVSDHQKYVDAFMDVVLPKENIVFVLHDWGSAFGFDWSRRHEPRVAGLAFMKFIHPINGWDDLPPIMATNWKNFRDPQIGRQMLIDDIFFIECLLPAGVIWKMGEEEWNMYRRPFLHPASREPIFRLPNELPLGGQPARAWDMAQHYTAWLVASEKPKLFFRASPRGIVWEDKADELVRVLKNTLVVDLGASVHYFQEDHPHAIGRALATWLPSY
ncbi:hypothetical protein ZTR_08502 [Talaromyces verruculosus]|nr:hypothetical protein ZTR_08502 [Talaromyces verruculosus]